MNKLQRMPQMKLIAKTRYNLRLTTSKLCDRSILVIRYLKVAKKKT